MRLIDAIALAIIAFLAGKAVEINKARPAVEMWR
jgi:hypothetical protein